MAAAEVAVAELEVEIRIEVNIKVTLLSGVAADDEVILLKVPFAEAMVLLDSCADTPLARANAATEAENSPLIMLEM